MRYAARVLFPHPSSLLPKESKPQTENKGKQLTVYSVVCFATGTFPSLLPAEEVCGV